MTAKNNINLIEIVFQICRENLRLKIDQFFSSLSIKINMYKTLK